MSKYQSKTVTFGGRDFTLFSLDGVTWSSRKDELQVIQERHDSQRVTLAQIRGEGTEEEVNAPAKADEGEAEEETPSAPRAAGPNRKPQQQPGRSPFAKRPIPDTEKSSERHAAIEKILSAAAEESIPAAIKSKRGTTDAKSVSKGAAKAEVVMSKAAKGAKKPKAAAAAKGKTRAKSAAA